MYAWGQVSMNLLKKLVHMIFFSPYFRRQVAYYVHMGNNAKFLKLKKKCSFGLMWPELQKLRKMDFISSDRNDLVYYFKLLLGCFRV